MHNIQDYEKPTEMMYIEMPKTDSIYFPHAMFKSNSSRESDQDNSHSPGKVVE